VSSPSELVVSDDPPVMKPIAEMSDREIAEETLYWLRFAGRAMSELQSSGMGKMMMGMMGVKR
jgi:hypothetical protein